MSTLEAIFSGVIGNSWRVAIVVMGFLAVRRVARGRVPAAALYAVWVLVAVRLLAPGGVPSEWSPYNLVSRAVEQSGSGAVEEPVEQSGSGAVVAASVSESTADRLAHARRHVTGAASVWLAGVALLLSIRLIAGWRLSRELRHATVADDPRLVEMARPLRVMVTDAISAPALHGIFRTALLFPPGLAAKLSDEELRLVVLHEMGHCRRRDLVSKSLIELAAIVHWFNPLVWLARKMARLDCEIACDEHVLRRERAAEQSAYGATLLKVLKLDIGGRSFSPALGILEEKEQLKQRIQMIISYKNPGAARFVAGAGLVALLAAFCLTTETKVQAAEVSAAPEPAPVGIPRSGQVRIGVRNDDNVDWNGERINFASFVERLGALGAADMSSPVVISSQNDLELSRVTRVWDAMRQAGVKRIRIETAFPPGSPVRIGEEAAREKVAIARRQIDEIQMKARALEDVAQKLEAQRKALINSGAEPEAVARQFEAHREELSRDMMELKVRMEQLRSQEMRAVPVKVAP